jgi:hypothetical protein
MCLFDILAVIGAVTGSAAALAQIASFWRDRPRLHVEFGTVDELGKPPRLWLSVLNHGRQPITVREAGFYGSEMPVEVISQEHGPMTGTAAYEYKVIREPVLLDPGQYHEEQTGVPDAVEVGYHVDFPFRAYAKPARGRRVWGQAAPITRMLVGEGDCPEGFPEHLWNPPSEPLTPARVEPRWKLWKRRGQPGRHSGDELIAATGTANAPKDV